MASYSKHQSFRQLTGLTRASAKQLVSRFVAMDMLVEITGQRRNRYFRYDSYVQLFADSNQ